MQELPTGISYRKWILNSAIYNQNQTFHLHGLNMSDEINLCNLYGKGLGDISPLKAPKKLWSGLSLS